MEIVVKLDELNRFQGKRVPLLATQHVTKNSFEVALIGIFKDVVTEGYQHPPDLTEGGWYTLHMMDYTDGHGRAEEIINEGQVVEISGYINVPLITSQTLLSLVEHGFGIIQQDHLFMAVIEVSQTAETSSDLHQEVTVGGEKLTQGNALGQILVLPALALPEVCPIRGALIVADLGLPPFFCLLPCQSLYLPSKLKLKQMLHVQHDNYVKQSSPKSKSACA